MEYKNELASRLAETMSHWQVKEVEMDDDVGQESVSTRTLAYGELDYVTSRCDVEIKKGIHQSIRCSQLILHIAKQHWFMRSARTSRQKRQEIKDFRRINRKGSSSINRS